MEDFLAGFDMGSVLDELNKSNEGKDMVDALGMNEEMEASSRRVQEYIMKHVE